MSYQRTTRPRPLSGFWSFVNTIIPPTRLIYDAGEEPSAETPSSSPYEWTASYQEAKQRALAEAEAAKKAAEAEKPGGGEAKKTSSTTIAVVLIAGYLLLK